MSDGDTRKVDEKSLKDPAKMMVPFAKFKSSPPPRRSSGPIRSG